MLLRNQIMVKKVRFNLPKNKPIQPIKKKKKATTTEETDQEKIMKANTRELFKKVQLPPWVPIGAIGLYAFTVGIDDECDIHKVKIGFSGRKNDNEPQKEKTFIKGGLYRRFYGYHTSLPDGVWTMSMLVVGSYAQPDKEVEIAQKVAAQLESRLKLKLKDMQKNHAWNFNDTVNSVYRNGGDQLSTEEFNKKVNKTFNDQHITSTCYHYQTHARVSGQGEWYVLSLRMLQKAFNEILEENGSKTKLFTGGSDEMHLEKLPIPTKADLAKKKLLGKINSMDKRGMNTKRVLLAEFGTQKQIGQEKRKETMEINKFIKDKSSVFAINHYEVDREKTNSYQLFEYDANNNSSKYCPNITSNELLIEARDYAAGAQMHLSGAKLSVREKKSVKVATTKKMNKLKATPTSGMIEKYMDWNQAEHRKLSTNGMTVADDTYLSGNDLKKYIEHASTIPLGSSIKINDRDAILESVDNTTNQYVVMFTDNTRQHISQTANIQVKRSNLIRRFIPPRKTVPHRKVPDNTNLITKITRLAKKKKLPGTTIPRYVSQLHTLSTNELKQVHNIQNKALKNKANNPVQIIQNHINRITGTTSPVKTRATNKTKKENINKLLASTVKLKDTAKTKLTLDKLKNKPFNVIKQAANALQNPAMRPIDIRRILSLT